MQQSRAREEQLPGRKAEPFMIAPKTLPCRDVREYLQCHDYVDPPHNETNIYIALAPTVANKYTNHKSFCFLFGFFLFVIQSFYTRYLAFVAFVSASWPPGGH